MGLGCGQRAGLRSATTRVVHNCEAPCGQPVSPRSGVSPQTITFLEHQPIKFADHTQSVVAIKAVAHKLARACYHVMKEGKPFEVSRAFG